MRKATNSGHVTALETPLLSLSDQDVWTLRDACQGVHIFGGSGSGKTSGSGRTLAEAYLRAGMGGLILCAKADEAELWQNYARAAGRERSVILLNEHSGARFNFLEYEMAASKGEISNIVALLMRLLEAAERAESPGNAGDPFWNRAVRELLSNALEALYVAYARIDLHQLMELVTSAPGPDQFEDPNWRANSFCFQTLDKAYRDPAAARDTHDLAAVIAYWKGTFGQLEGRTRANIVISLTSQISPFLKGAPRRLFCTDTTIVPELTHEGSILILDLPTKEWHEVGVLTQQLIKYVWQRAAERRPVSDSTRPIFLWVDEAQYFVNRYDAEFQATARSARVASVFITQDRSAYIPIMGGRAPHEAVNNLLSHFQTKIFHTNTDPQTNQWAADLIGKTRQLRAGLSDSDNWGENSSTQHGTSSGFGGSSSHGPGGATHSSNWNSGVSEGASTGTSTGTAQSFSVNEIVDYELQPAELGRHMRTGRSTDNGMVDGIIFKGGQPFAHSETNWLRVSFAQELA